MSSNPAWLEALQHATTYRQLQDAFDQMSLAAAHQDPDGTLASLIDEAIRRIEQERVHDEAELAEFNQQYDEFKGQNAGVVGWFKRKMPFTATRKQDVELRDTMRDQQAEILADNFVIARAQMLKESILPMDLARTGKPCSYYRQQLAMLDSVTQLRDFGRVLVQVSRDVPAAEHFLTEIRNDIDAFAAARFTENDEQQLQKLGLTKARAELGKLTETVEEKKKVVSAADERLRLLVEQELAANDPTFHTLQKHLVQFKEFVEQCEGTKPVVDARGQLLVKVKQRVSELKETSAKIKSLDVKRDKTSIDLQAAQNTLQHADAEFQPVSQRYEAARQAADQANVRVETTKPLVAAYLAEQGLDAESTASHAHSSSLCAEYESLKAAAATGQAQLAQIASQYENANRRRNQLQSEVDKLNKTAADLKLDLSKLQQDIAGSEGELVALCDQLRLAKLQFQLAVQTWLNKRAQLNWHSGFALPQTLPGEMLEDLFGQQLITSIHTPRDSAQLTRIDEAMSRFSDQFQKAWISAKSARQQLEQDRLAALQQRSRLLLEGELADRLFGRA